MAQLTRTVAQGILNGQGYTDNEVRQLAYQWLALHDQPPPTHPPAPAGAMPGVQGKEAWRVPCPFCGSEYTGRALHRGSQVIECQNCSARGPQADDADGAKSAWATRATAPTPQPAPATQQAGWKCAPVEPTDAMVQAAHHIDLSYMPGQEGADRAAIYRAMLAAAPQPSPTAQAAESAPAVGVVELGWKYAETYRGDDRQDIRTDVFNAFCAGAKHTARAPAESVGRDAELLHYACDIGPNQAMNWQDIYDDWNGEGEFIDALRAAMAANGDPTP